MRIGCFRIWWCQRYPAPALRVSFLRDAWTLYIWRLVISWPSRRLVHLVRKAFNTPQITSVSTPAKVIRAGEEATAELKKLTPSNTKLLKLAEKHPAPQEWYDE